jgi:hypothetical protein
MKLTYFIISLLLITASMSYGQRRSAKIDKQPKEGEFPMTPGLLISTNVFSITEPDGGPSLAVEYRYSLHWSVLLEGTAILYQFMGEDALEHATSGFRLRPEVRYYFAGKHKTYRGFFSVEGSYKQVRYYEPVTLDQGNYYEKSTYQRTKRMGGGAFKIGFQTYFGKKKHIMFELYGGVGLKYRTYDDAAMPDNAYIPTFRDAFKFDDPGLMPNIPMGVKFGYRL